jgi:hypothetical protein
LVSSTRTPHRDKALEIYLKEGLGWENTEIAEWATSTNGRHFGDGYTSLEWLLSYRFKNYQKDIVTYIPEKHRHQFTELLQPLFDQNEKSINRPLLRKLNGHIWWEENTTKIHTQGGLSDNLYALIIKNKTPFGYYKHYKRTTEFDLLLEFILTQKGYTTAKMAKYLTSPESHPILEFCTDGFELCAYPNYPKTRKKKELARA